MKSVLSYPRILAPVSKVLFRTGFIKPANHALGGHLTKLALLSAESRSPSRRKQTIALNM